MVNTASAAAIDKSEIKRWVFLLLGIGLFVLTFYSPPWPDAIDPAGKHFVLSHEGKGALAVFLLAGTWWVFEVLPIGVTGLAIGVFQTLFFIRPAKDVFGNFMDPSVLFIFGSIVIGQVFTKTGLTRRMAYTMLSVVGERTSMIYLGCFSVTVVLTHFMAHTAVAATIYPLLLAIHGLYAGDNAKTRFGKGLFIGMAYVAGAGSIVTLLGAARGAVAIGFFRDIAGKSISFFEYSYYFFPVGWLMMLLIWGLIMILCKPEKATIPGLKQRARQLRTEMGPLTRNEVMATSIILTCVAVLALQSFFPPLAKLNKSAILIVTTLLFYVLNILEISDLEQIPWNIILLFSGAMSMGLCLWETQAANWLAVNWLAMFKNANWFVFVMSIGFFVMIMTNFIMNVAAIAISLPVALVIAPYLGVAPEVIFYAALVTAGMPFMLLIGAAPNAIAYDSNQFTTVEFFIYGVYASIILMAVLAFAIYFLWPMMGMPVKL
ncbi:SLC13 family permease [uncultured Desulfosarcina sp.]|uniref:SLC13 family permease n=1 Tax=uncultured Desulfosarcina sp. TaxID=218289 RepID=UPI003747AF77